MKTRVFRVRYDCRDGSKEQEFESFEKSLYLNKYQ
jgi:hypothetical protein